MKVGKAIHIILIAVIAAILGSHILLNNKKTQQDVANYASAVLSETLGTDVVAESFSFTHPCGISLKNLLIDDHNGDTLFAASTVKLQFRLIPLLKGSLDITKVNLISPYINIYREDSGSATNLGVILVHVQPQKNIDNSKNIKLRANSIFIKNGKVAYNVNSEVSTPDKFNHSHILLEDITTKISLKHLSSDSINTRLRNLSFTERSGVAITKGNGALKAGKDNLLLNNLNLHTKNSNIRINTIEASSILSGILWNIDMQSSVVGADFTAFLPQTATMTEKIAINLQAEGDKSKYTINSLNINDADNTFDIGVSASVTNNNDGSTPYSVKDFSINNGVGSGSATANLHKFLTNQLSGFNVQIPEIIGNIGKFNTEFYLNGELNDLTADATLISDIGNASVSIALNPQNERIEISSNKLELGKLIANNNIGTCSISMKTNGKILTSPRNGSFHGNVNSIRFNNYSYNNIAINGSLLNDTISSKVTYNDPNADVTVLANILPDKTDTYTSLKMDINHLNLSELNFTSRDSLIVSANIVAESMGNTLDLLRGELSIDSLSYYDSGGKFQTDHTFNLTITENSYNRRDLSLKSEIANIDIVGDYLLSTLPHSLAFVLESTLPTFSEWLLNYKSNRHRSQSYYANSFLIDAQLRPTEFYNYVLHIPLEINETINLQCSVNENNGIAKASVYIPDVSYYQNSLLDGNIDFNSDNGDTKVHIKGNYSNNTLGNEVNISFAARNDSLNTNIQWSSAEMDELNLNIAALTTFEHFDKQNKWLKSSHQMKESGITFNNTDWEISKFQIATDSGKVSIDNFRLANNNQSISVDGLISADSTDILDITLRDIDIDNLFKMFNINDTEFSGIASADVTAMSLLESPAFYGEITADNFSFLGSYGGRLVAEGIWNQELECIDIEASMNDEEVSSTLLSGYYSPKNRYLDIDIDAQNTDLYFLNRFTKNIFREVNGNAVGNIRLFGNLDALDLEGKAILKNGILDQSILNTHFIIKHDTVVFEPGKMFFHNVEFYDEFDNKGTLMCNIQHTYLNDFSVQMDADVTNMQVLNIARTESTDIFANVFTTGKINLTADNNIGLIVRADATTAPGTRFGYNLSAGPVADNSFLRIVDSSASTNSVNNETTEKSVRSRKKEKEINTDVQLNFSINCTEDAAIDLLMDPLNGTVFGNGQIRANYSNKQGINLLGRYNVSRGYCDFSLEDLIRKEFRFSEESSHVTFNGHPSTAELNLHTYHTVNSVSLSDLDVNLSSDNNVRVNCLMDITGTVLAPSLAFNIELPQGSQEEKEAIKSSTSTEEQTNLQFMYLLTMGRFYSYDYANTNSNTSPGTVESFFNNTVNTQINNLLSQVVNNNNFSLSSNVTAGSYLNNDPANLTNKELEGILEAHLLNNRLLINGNFGYRENAMTNTSNFIGDIEVEWLMIKKPKISLKGYNKANDKYFSKTSLYTQGIGIAYEADF